MEEPILAHVEGVELDETTIAAVVARCLEDAVYLERLPELSDARESVECTSGDGITAERAVAWLRALSETWRAAEVPAERADLLRAAYHRITVAIERPRQQLEHLPPPLMSRTSGISVFHSAIRSGWIMRPQTRSTRNGLTAEARTSLRPKALPSRSSPACTKTPRARTALERN